MTSRARSLEAAKIACSGSLFPAVLAAPGPTLGQTAVTTYGQTVSGAAVLTGDLECSSAGTDGVIFDGNGSLDLRGFPLTADSG